MVIDTFISTHDTPHEGIPHLTYESKIIQNAQNLVKLENHEKKVKSGSG